MHLIILSFRLKIIPNSLIHFFFILKKFQGSAKQLTNICPFFAAADFFKKWLRLIKM